MLARINFEVWFAGSLSFPQPKPGKLTSDPIGTPSPTVPLCRIPSRKTFATFPATSLARVSNVFTLRSLLHRVSRPHRKVSDVETKST